MKITECTARGIDDSRGRPTIETTLSNGEFAVSASVPSGKSVGSGEAFELRDADERGVESAVEMVNKTIFEALRAGDFDSPQAIDKMLRELDGTPDKRRLGANSILSVSIAAVRLFAKAAHKPLWRYIADLNKTAPAVPKLFVNVINGGAHAAFNLPFQEYMLIASGATVREEYDNVSILFRDLGELLKKTCGGEVPMGEEGGYSPTFSTVEKPFEILSELTTGYPDVDLGIDVAATQMRRDGKYQILGQGYSREELGALYGRLHSDFGVASIEDPFAEDDIDGFKWITALLGGSSLIIGDDLTVTNPERITNMIAEKAANAVIIKPNQIGTVSEACEAFTIATRAGWKTVVSHRSGETDDSFIADLAYGLGAYAIKAGGLGQWERTEKYDRLLAIEAEANASAPAAA